MGGQIASWYTQQEHRPAFKTLDDFEADAVDTRLDAVCNAFRDFERLPMTGAQGSPGSQWWAHLGTPVAFRDD